MEKEITYQIEELLNNTYRIDEGGAANCYLVIGEENALLIDSCWGSGNLKECVAQLTEKPVIVTMTHRHPDHTFGARQFGDYYVSKKDNILFNRVLDSQLMGRLSQKANVRNDQVKIALVDGIQGFLPVSHTGDLITILCKYPRI